MFQIPLTIHNIGVESLANVIIAAHPRDFAELLNHLGAVITSEHVMCVRADLDDQGRRLSGDLLGVNEWI